jgi:tRNA (guanine37-N1)-methyltransferase
MIFHILTLFPSLFAPFLGESIVEGAVAKGLIDVRLLNFRDFAAGRHKVVDDRPFGGGPGMVLKPEPIFAAVESVLTEDTETPVKPILLTPQGQRYNQKTAIRLSQEKRILLLCGRYEGFDERIRMGFPWEEISIGDFVLSGGEVAAMCLVESITRLLPGALGHEQSAWDDSFSRDRLEFPQYTRPRSFRGVETPEILLSGDHAKIAAWRRKKSMERTLERRPDLRDKIETRENEKTDR